MENLVSLITAKAIQSNKDDRMASVVSINGDEVTLEIEAMGFRTLSIRDVFRGFAFYMDYESLVKGFLERQGLRKDIKMSGEDIHNLSIQMFDLMTNRFKDLKHIECYRAVKNYSVHF